MAGISSQTLIDDVADHLLSTGYFDFVNQHEPKTAPNRGLTAAVWIDEIEPIRSSGMNSTTVRVAFNARIYQNFIKQPQDMIDPEMMDAADAFFSRVTGDFTLGGVARQVDLLGAYGKPLLGQSGYINIDNKVYRVFTMTIPVIINDAWTQAE